MRAAEAVQLLQTFYARGNPSAPDHKRQRPLQPDAVTPPPAAEAPLPDAAKQDGAEPQA